MKNSLPQSVEQVVAVTLPEELQDSVVTEVSDLEIEVTLEQEPAEKPVKAEKKVKVEKPAKVREIAYPVTDYATALSMRPWVAHMVRNLSKPKSGFSHRDTFLLIRELLLKDGRDYRTVPVDDIIAVLKNYCVEHPEHPVAVWLNVNVKARTAILKENIQFGMCSVLTVIDNASQK